MSNILPAIIFQKQLILPETIPWSDLNGQRAYQEQSEEQSEETPELLAGI